MSDARARLIRIFLAASIVGIFSGLFGIGGGALLTPLLVLLFGFSQHRAQGTTLVALVPPTGLLAFLAYYHAGHVSIRIGLLMMPGIVVGGWLGGKLAARFRPRLMRQMFAGFLFALGLWQVASRWLS